MSNDQETAVPCLPRRNGMVVRSSPSGIRRRLRACIIALKFALPAVMLRAPAAGAWGNYVLDSVDGDLLLELGLPDSAYQTIDKTADFFSYGIMLIVGVRWRIRPIIVALFVYRAIGQGLYFATRNDRVFALFPNFLEPLVLAYTLLLAGAAGSEAGAYAAYRRHRGLIWLIIVSYKLWNEWYLHIAKIDLSSRVFGVTGGARRDASTASRRLPAEASGTERSPG